MNSPAYSALLRDQDPSARMPATCVELNKTEHCWVTACASLVYEAILLGLDLLAQSENCILKASEVFCVRKHIRAETRESA